MKSPLKLNLSGKEDAVQENKVRAVIDTNIWIAFLIGKTLSGLREAILKDSIKILFSEELFVELIEVLRRPKFSKYFSQEDIEELISLLHCKTELVAVQDQVAECRDPKDNFLLELCLSGNADCLITGDEDLLALNPFRGVKIINYRMFQEEMLL
jgi:putative PIN family toxin of toxin-antitoxin system